MCGRFSQAYSWDEIVAFSRPLTVPADRPNLQARYNINPTTEIDIIIKTDAGRELRKARWGFVPTWHKGEAKEVKNTFNARVEGVRASKMFGRAFVKRRCIIPASAFYEWTGAKGEKIPHRISAADGGLLAFAGIWETWRDPATSEDIVTVSIITRSADRFMEKLHSRMPAMLRPEDFDAWLNGSGGEDLLQRPPPELREWIVSTRINNVRAPDDDQTLADPVEPKAEEPKPPPDPPAQGDLF